MNFFLPALIAALASTSDAFTVNQSTARRGTQMMAQVSSENLVAEALKMSKEFGATSSEARLAWEAVEEVDASDNSAATKGNLNDECDVEVVSKDCLEYSEAIEELQELLKASKPKVASLSDNLATSLGNVKLSTPDASAAPQSKELQAALAEAREITEKEGLSSSAAAVAWETVEEIAAAGNSNALGGALSDDECLVEAAQEACAALEELSRIIESRK